MYKKSIFLALLFCITNASLYGVTINSPGKYVMGDNIIEPGTALLIASSQVIVDLDEHVVAGTDFGIVIQAGVQNVLIYNGVVAGGSQAGISVGQNCRGIILRDMQVAGTLARGIEFLGTLGNIIDNVRLERVILDRCGLLPSADAAMFGSFVRDIACNGMGFIQCGNAASDFSVVHFENLVGGVLNAVITRSCTGASLKAFDFANSQGTILEECFALDHTTTDPLGSLIGYNFADTSSGSLLRGCVVATCTSVGECVGFTVNTGAGETTFRGCGVIHNTGNSFSGFVISNDDEALHDILFECNCAQNTATGDGEFCIGIFAENANESAVQSTICAYNFAPTGTAVGLLFSDQGTGVDNWTVSQCKFITNKGIDDQSSFGVWTQEGQDNLFIENRAFTNGNLMANQFKGVPAGSVTQITPSTVNSASAPFSNIAVTT